MQDEKKSESLNVNISVENFGPIEKADIDLRPLTIFVGESNTGKTYLATLIYTLQAIFEGIPRVPWSYYNTSRFNPIYYSQPADLSTQELIEEKENIIQKLADTDLKLKFKELPLWIRDRLLSGSAHFEAFENEVKRCFESVSVSELRKITKRQNEVMKISLLISEVNQTLWSIDFYNSGFDTKIKKSINEEIVLDTSDRKIFQKALDVKDQDIPLRSLVPMSITFYHLIASRSGIMETHGVITSSLVDRATRGRENDPYGTSMLTGSVTDFLKHIINYEDCDILSSDILEISKTLEDEVLHGNIEVNRPEGLGYPQFYFRPKNSEHGIRMNRSSSMVSELAPLVLYLRSVVKPGDTLIIEEPESHLHPRAQTQIAVVLAKLVRVGVKVIITTHSEWLLEQIGNLVREGEVKKTGKNPYEPTTWLTVEEVGAWRFSQEQPVEEVKFDPINGFEPIDYGEVAEGLYNQSVDLRTLLMEKSGDNTSEE